MKKGDFWKGQGKWASNKGEKGNWISQPEEQELKRPRIDKGKEGFKGKEKGWLSKGEAPFGEMELGRGLGKGPLMAPPPLGPPLVGPPATVPVPHLGPLSPCLPLPKVLPAPMPVAAPGQPVFLAPATKHITPVSTRATNTNNKKIAMEFVHATKDVQAQMLKDPAVARAILQTLAESPGGCMQNLGMPGGVVPPPPLATAPATLRAPTMALPQFTAPAAPAWTGVITVARNMAKKTPFRAALIQGKVSDVEVALRSAAANASVADITHRVPFDEVGKKVHGSSILSLYPNSLMEQASFEEYNKYFRSKSRAGVARLDESLALYVMPAGEDIPALRESLYTLGPHIPRVGCLIGLIGPGTPAVNAAKPVKQEEAKLEKEKEKKSEPKDDEPQAEPVPAGAGDAAAPGMSGKELMDLFSNPDLIQLLQKEVTGATDAG